MDEKFAKRFLANRTALTINKTAEDRALHRGVCLGHADPEVACKPRERSIARTGIEKPEQHHDVLGLEHALCYSRIANSSKNRMVMAHRQLEEANGLGALLGGARSQSQQDRTFPDPPRLTVCLSECYIRFMEQQDRFMNELFRIVSGALRLDVGKVRNYTTFLAEKLEKGGDKNAATRLRKLLEETDHELRPARISGARSLPVDEESRFPLVERVAAREGRERPVVLSESQWVTVNEFLSVAKSYGQLEVAGIETSLSLLMYGPPGCGKSRLARHIAAELGLDLYVARLDGLVSSYLGSTSKNIRALFDFAASTPCVLFLDEFDAIAKLRGDSNELGELKRVVNSFIQNLDSAPKSSVVLAATNHEDLLDSAIWRRFSYRLQFERPDKERRQELLRNFLPPLVLADKEIDLLVDLADGFSGSDIQEVCLRLQRVRVTTGREPELSDAFRAMQNLTLGEGGERRFLSSLRGLSDTEMSTMLRKRDRRLYSHALVAQLLGVSKATAFRLAKKGAGDG